MPKKVPRWQQGFRPFAHRDTWEAMSPAQRRRAFLSDIAVALSGAAILYGLLTLFMTG